MKRFLVALALVAAALPNVAQQPDVRTHSLPNGLRVLTLEDRSIPMISLFVFYRVGSRNERPGITGVSHLFEHMMFNGSGKFKPKEFDLHLEMAGSGGNGYTTTDFTAYLETFPKSAIDTVLDLESDRMKSLLITPENLEQERGIVKEERRVRTDNIPRGRMYEELMAASFVAHPYGWPVVGWMKDLDAIKLDEATRYFNDYYGPNNATLVVVGDFVTADLLKRVERFFGGIAARGNILPVVDNEPEQQGERRVTLEKEAALPAVMLGFKAPPVRHADAPAIEMLEAILERGESSRLYRKLVYGGLATETSASFLGFDHPSSFLLFAQAQEGKSAAQCEKAIDEVLADIRQNGVTDTELQKARNQLRARLAGDLQTMEGKANLIGTADIRYGSPTALFARADQYDKVTRDDIRRVAQSLFVPRARTVVTLVIPEKAAAAAGGAR
ncbi:MAG TPA: pitrilysin family protein [Thermoanaerobaculia bacterium]|jgi:zinc protease|nr:pitrilysin family protein [Thermoanaerobaculia bacterium]